MAAKENIYKQHNQTRKAKNSDSLVGVKKMKGAGILIHGWEYLFLGYWKRDKRQQHCGLMSTKQGQTTV